MITRPAAAPRTTELDLAGRGLLGDQPHNPDQVLHDQVAFMPPPAWEGETVARFAFLHPHTTIGRPTARRLTDAPIYAWLLRNVRGFRGMRSWRSRQASTAMPVRYGIPRSSA